MRTTLTIDDDVLAYARGVAQQDARTIGEVISALARAALPPPPGCKIEMRGGIPSLPRRAKGAVITLEYVNALRDGLP